jgi:hypothetical protein
MPKWLIKNIERIMSLQSPDVQTEKEVELDLKITSQAEPCCEALLKPQRADCCRFPSPSPDHEGKRKPNPHLFVDLNGDGERMLTPPYSINLLHLSVPFITLLNSERKIHNREETQIMSVLEVMCDTCFLMTPLWSGCPCSSSAQPPSQREETSGPHLHPAAAQPSSPEPALQIRTRGPHSHYGCQRSLTANRCIVIFLFESVTTFKSKQFYITIYISNFS